VCAVAGTSAKITIGAAGVAALSTIPPVAIALAVVAVGGMAVFSCCGARKYRRYRHENIIDRMVPELLETAVDYALNT